MRALVVVVLAVLASGCTLGAPPPATSPPMTTPSDAPDERAVPDPLVKTRLPLALSVDERWVKPSEQMVAHASAPPGASVGWFLAPRNPDVPNEENYEFVPRALATLLPGSSSQAIVMDQTGRYAYGARERPEASFNVTVVSGLPRDRPVAISFVEDSWGARFAPSEVLAGVGAPVTVRNLAPRDVTPVRTDQMIRVAADGPDASITPPILLGDYDLVALARDAHDGWGQATARLIVDSRRPDANVTLGPWTGSFPLAQTAASEERAVESRFGYATLNVTFAATTSAAAGDASIRVSLRDATGHALASKEGASGRVELRSIPNGTLVLRIEAVSGVQVQWRVEGEGRLDLVPPESFFHK